MQHYRIFDHYSTTNTNQATYPPPIEVPNLTSENPGRKELRRIPPNWCLPRITKGSISATVGLDLNPSTPSFFQPIIPDLSYTISCHTCLLKLPTHHHFHAMYLFGPKTDPNSDLTAKIMCGRGRRSATTAGKNADRCGFGIGGFVVLDCRRLNGEYEGWR
jgi:hypothetical protein